MLFIYNGVLKKANRINTGLNLSTLAKKFNFGQSYHSLIGLNGGILCVHNPLMLSIIHSQVPLLQLAIYNERNRFFSSSISMEPFELIKKIECEQSSNPIQSKHKADKHSSMKQAEPAITTLDPSYLEYCSGCGEKFHDENDHGKNAKLSNNELSASKSAGYLQNLYRKREEWIKLWKDYQFYSSISSPTERSIAYIKKEFLDPSKFSQHDLERINKRISAHMPSLLFQHENEIMGAGLKKEDLSPLNFQVSIDVHGDKDVDEDSLLSKPPQFLCQRCLLLRKNNSDDDIETLLENCTESDQFNDENPTIVADDPFPSTTITKSYWSEKEKEYLRDNILIKNTVIFQVVDLVDFPSSLIIDMDNLLGVKNMTEKYDVSGTSSISSSATFSHNCKRMKDIPVVLVGNKADLIPGFDEKNIHLLQDWLQCTAAALGMKAPIKTLITSSKTGFGLDRLAKCIIDLGIAKDKGRASVFFIGHTNVGKSSLWNSLMKKFKVDTLISPTISPEAGTTAGFIKVPIKLLKKSLRYPTGFLYDTPGIFNRNHLINYLTLNEINRFIIPKRSPIKPSSYLLVEGRCLFLGGLVRIDFERVDNGNVDPGVNDGFDSKRKTGQLYVTLTVSNRLPIHISSIEKAEELYKKHLGCHPAILRPPVFSPFQHQQEPKNQHLNDTVQATEMIKEMRNFPPLKLAHTIENYSANKIDESNLEVSISAIGHVNFSGHVTNGVIKIYSTNGEGIVQRIFPLTPYSPIEGRVGGCTGSKAKYYHVSK